MSNVINLGKINNKPLNVSTDILTTHTAVLGTTGSGKTGLLLGEAEELARNGVPTILVDVKGDLINLALQKESEVADKMRIRYVTPGATHGEPVDLLHGLNDPSRITPTVTALLKLIGKDADPLRSVEHAFLSYLLKFRHEHALGCSLTELVGAIIEPGFESLGAMDLGKMISLKSRISLASALNTVLVAPSFEPWKYGTALDVDELLSTGSQDDRTPIVIYSVAHLVDDDDRIFALSLLFDAVVSWCRTLNGSKTLKYALIVDEVFGLLPPYPANPATKKPLITLLKQARAHGVGLTLATQNPVDMDYKALGNCGLWLVGLLQTGKDRAKVLEGITSTAMFNTKKLEQNIANLKQREFVLARNGQVHTFRTRDVNCDLVGPMGPKDISALYQAGRLEEVNSAKIVQQKLEEAKAMFAKSSDPQYADKVAQYEHLLGVLTMEVA